MSRKALVLAVVVVAGIALGFRLTSTAQQPSTAGLTVDADDIGGVVTGPNGPEAGVWVIAETTDLPTKYRKIVVTDDRGRYLLPDLPKASYRVWVRGYGLVDSTPVQTSPGRELALPASLAPNARAAAQYYPADAWLSLIQVPPKSEFPMTITVPAGRGGGFGAPAAGGGTQERVLQTQAEWIGSIKGCMNCQELGNKATRELPSYLNGLSPTAAWERRLQFGQVSSLGAVVGGHGRERGLAMYADWTSRIAAGEVPPAPPRPQGIERSVVVTLWDVSTPTAFVHDIVSTDKRNPTANAYGPVYGVEFHHDSVMVLDPRRNTADLVPIP